MSTSTREAQLIGDSTAMHHLRAQITRVASSQIPVLIEGPTGSGKELVAQALHRESERKGPLVAVNVCAIADTMFEDAMFGHVRGAFSGAIGDHTGYLLEAHRGTVFLDEIGSLAIGAQIKLLRALETHEFRPVGARGDRTSDFRLIAATNVPLAKAVSEGAFRADLAFRLSGVVIRVPSLSAHIEDIPPLARYFARRYGAHREISVELTDGALGLLANHSWPGNVRELSHVIARVVAFATSEVIDRNDIKSAMEGERQVCQSEEPNEHLFERRRLLDSLRTFAWDTARTAEHLGVHRASIYRKVQRLGIDMRALKGADSNGSVAAARDSLPESPEGRPTAM